MKRDKGEPLKAAELRRRAEQRLRERKTEVIPPGTEQDTLRLLHELQVHQVELEMQNEELMAARAEVEAGLERYTDLYDFAPVGYFTLGRDGAIRQANITGARLLGIDRSGLVNRRFGLLVSQEDRPAFNAFLERVFAGQAGEACEVVLAREADEPLAVRIEATACEDGQECRAVARDVTQRRRAEEALRQSEERLRLALEGADLGSWDWHVATGKAAFNERWAAMLGYPVEEIEPHWRAWESRVHPEDWADVQETLARHLTGETPVFEKEHRLWHKSGTWVWILSKGKVIERDVSGKPVRMCGTHLDVTARRRLEEQLRQSQKMDSVGRLAGGVAHNFNNMLTGILGYAQLMDQSLHDDPEFGPMIGHILTVGRRAADLSNKLLSFARQKPMMSLPVDVHRNISAAIAMLSSMVDRRVAIHRDLRAAECMIRGDGDDLFSVWVNLAINACDAMPDGGELSFATECVDRDQIPCCPGLADLRPGKYIQARVSDNGTGMDPETVGHLFDPFFTTKGLGRGTGLGLATVYGCVQQHGGGVHVESKPGRGTTVGIWLPLAPEQGPGTVETP